MMSLPDVSIVLHVLLALALGWLLGYERYSRGRAAGTQVYGLVCIAACALTSASGQPTNFVGSIPTGIGYYVAAVCVTVLLIACTVLLPHVEGALRVQIALGVSLRYCQGHRSEEGAVHAFLQGHGPSMHADSLSVTYEDGSYRLHLLVTTGSITRAQCISRVAGELPGIPHVESSTIDQTSRS